MNVLLIDDHPLILSALEVVVRSLAQEVSVACAPSSVLAREALAASDFDLALLDLQLGDDNGFDLLVELRAAFPAVPIVIVSASDRRADVLRAIDLGAMGFVCKCAGNDTLLTALEMVMSGGIYLPPTIMRTVARADDDASYRLHEGSAARGMTGLPGESTDIVISRLGLTRRQSEVLALLLRGQSNKLIARALNLSVETIKDHVAAVLRALKVSSRTQAVLVVGEMSNPGATWRHSSRGAAPRPDDAPATALTRPS